jgi:hypothetical protein
MMLEPALDAVIFNAAKRISEGRMNCTSIDHIYPSTTDGTPCYCGARRWNQDGQSYSGPTGKPKVSEKKLPRKGAHVEVRTKTGTPPTLRVIVIDVDRDGQMFRVDMLDGWFEIGDLV